VLDLSLAVASDDGRIPKVLGVEPNVPMVLADPNLLRQAFDNAVANAVHAVEGEGEIEVSVGRRVVDGVDSVEIRFADDRQGMNDDVCAQARAPLFTTRSTGTGLGLSIVERIVQAHGGRLTIASQPGAGTSVSVTLAEAEPPSSAVAPR
jgi:signal transduction histidine kinase